MTQDSEWIEWNGGECPVALDTIVQVRIRDGGEFRPSIAVIWGDGKDANLSNWAWTPDEASADDIIAYRIVEQQP